MLEMGEPVRIMDLARDMIRLSGLEPGRDIAIEIVGARPGEKLHEELFNPYERPEPTAAPKILRAERAAARPRTGSRRRSTRSACSCSRATPPRWPRRSPSWRPCAARRGGGAGRPSRARSATSETAGDRLAS